MSEYQQINEIKDNLTLDMSVTLECVICGKNIILEEEADDDDEISVKLLKQKLANKAYKKGWRNSASQVFLHIGIHCNECHINRNNKNFFNEK